MPSDQVNAEFSHLMWTNFLGLDTINGSSVGVTATNPTGTASGLAYGWAGSHWRETGSFGLVSLGARAFNPVVGQFSSSDPVPGGNETSYNYPDDPINASDYSGCAICRKGERWSRYAGYPTYRYGAWRRGSELLFGLSHMISNIESWFDWEPGVHIDAEVEEERYRNVWETQKVHTCDDGVKTTEWYTNETYYAEGWFKVTLSAGVWKFKYTRTLWEGWVGDPFTWGNEVGSGSFAERSGWV